MDRFQAGMRSLMSGDFRPSLISECMTPSRLIPMLRKAKKRAFEAAFNAGEAVVQGTAWLEEEHGVGPREITAALGTGVALLVMAHAGVKRYRRRQKTSPPPNATGVLEDTSPCGDGHKEAPSPDKSTSCSGNMPPSPVLGPNAMTSKTLIGETEQSGLDQNGPVNNVNMKPAQAHVVIQDTLIIAPLQPQIGAVAMPLHDQVVLPSALKERVDQIEPHESIIPTQACVDVESQEGAITSDSTTAPSMTETLPSSTHLNPSDIQNNIDVAMPPTQQIFCTQVTEDGEYDHVPDPVVNPEQEVETQQQPTEPNMDIQLKVTVTLPAKVKADWSPSSDENDDPANTLNSGSKVVVIKQGHRRIIGSQDDD